MPLYELGDLGSIIRHAKEDDQPIPEPDVLRILHQLANGLSLVHSRDIIHRQIKPSNIFLSRQFDLVISDFGSRKMVNSLNSMSGLGDAKYKAIEILEQEDYMYAPSADIWSLGVVMYEVMSMKEKKMAFQARKTRKSAEMLTKFQNDLLNEMNAKYKYSAELTGLILRMLDVNPDNRPTANNILEHQFQAPAKKEELETINELKQTLDQLMKEKEENKNLFLQKQQIIRDRKLLCFYERFQQKFFELVILLKSEAKTISIAGHLVDIQGLEKHTNMFTSKEEMETIVEAVARKLTLYYEKQIKKVALDDKKSFTASFKKVFHIGEIRVDDLSECAVGRILDGMASDMINPSKLIPSLLRAVSYSKRSQATYKMLPDCKIQLEKATLRQWTDRGLFQQTGLEGPKNNKYQNPDKNASYLNKVDVYGYRACDEDEILFAQHFVTSLTD
jgi:hypothetical protein